MLNRWSVSQWVEFGYFYWAKSRNQKWFEVRRKYAEICFGSSSCYEYCNGAIKINSVQATDLDDFSNDTDIKCRITLWLMLLLTHCGGSMLSACVWLSCSLLPLLLLGARYSLCVRFVWAFDISLSHLSLSLCARSTFTHVDIILLLDSFSALAFTLALAHVLPSIRFIHTVEQRVTESFSVHLYVECMCARACVYERLSRECSCAVLLCAPSLCVSECVCGEWESELWILNGYDGLFFYFESSLHSLVFAEIVRSFGVCVCVTRCYCYYTYRLSAGLLACLLVSTVNTLDVIAVLMNW